MAQDNNMLVDAINKEVRSHTADGGAPTFTLDAQRKFSAFSGGIVKRSALEFVREGPTYFSPKPPEHPGIAGVPFYTSFKRKSVWELQKARAKASVGQMGPYKPPSEFSFREESGDTAQETKAANVVRQEIAELQSRLTSDLSSTKKYRVKQLIKQKKAQLAKETAEFSCKFRLNSIQDLKKHTAVNQDGIFDDSSLQPGDKVLVHFPSDKECWRGPFRVVARVNACLFKVTSPEFGTMDVDVARLQDMRLSDQEPTSPSQSSAIDHGTHFVLNVGRSTAKDAVMALAKEAGSKRGPYHPPSAHEYVSYDSDEAALRKLTGPVGGAQPSTLELTRAEREAQRLRAEFNETKRKNTAV